MKNWILSLLFLVTINLSFGKGESGTGNIYSAAGESGTGNAYRTGESGTGNIIGCSYISLNPNIDANEGVYGRLNPSTNCNMPMGETGDFQPVNASTECEIRTGGAGVFPIYFSPGSYDRRMRRSPFGYITLPDVLNLKILGTEENKAIYLQNFFETFQQQLDECYDDNHCVSNPNNPSCSERSA